MIAMWTGMVRKEDASWLTWYGIVFYMTTVLMCVQPLVRLGGRWDEAQQYHNASFESAAIRL